MADTLDCSPCYAGRPDYDPTGGTAILPQETLRRSRLFAGGTFFRSKLTVPGSSDFQGELCNSIALEITIVTTVVTLTVYFEDVAVETYVTSQDVTCPTLGSGVAIPALRSMTASSVYISMPARDTDVNDPGGIDDACVSAFAKTSMSGGAGPGEADVATIRTGPDRTIVFIANKENSVGTLFEPGAGSNLLQWDYDDLQWIGYVIDSDCALPENRCP